jgi:hypothetical protein
MKPLQTAKSNQRQLGFESMEARIVLTASSPVSLLAPPPAVVEVEAIAAPIDTTALQTISVADADFNGDGLIDADDIDMLAKAIEGDPSEGDFDLNGDSEVTKADMDSMIHDWLGTEYGDANLDQAVDLEDFNYWRFNAFQSGGWAAGDFTGDGLVDGLDFLQWNANKSFVSVATVVQVDEAVDETLETETTEIVEESKVVLNQPLSKAESVAESTTSNLASANRTSVRELEAEESKEERSEEFQFQMNRRLTLRS